MSTEKKTQYLEHTVLEMDESGMQHCVKCGAIITDYRGTLSLDGDTPKGFAAGIVYMTENISPRITTTFLADSEESFDCMNTMSPSINKTEQ